MALIWSVAGISDLGLKRSRNEDTLAVDQANGIVIVADGLGGRLAGDYASALAARTVQETLTSQSSSTDLGDRMVEAVKEANQRVWDAADEEPERAGMGTTVTALAIDRDSDRWVIGHVGDSRGYRLRDGSLERITRDHTVVQELVDAGALSVEAARSHPLGHIINRAVGTDPAVEIDVFHGTAAPGDLFLLCSDGLAGLISDEELEDALKGVTAVDLEEAAANLLAVAHERGAPDNVTLGLLAITPAA